MSLQQHFASTIRKAQHEEFCQKKLMKSIENSFDVSNLELFLNIYTKSLYQFYVGECADKNPFVSRGLEFLAKLAVRITLKCVQPIDVTNPNGTVSQIYDITTDPFFTNLLKQSLKYASVEKSEVRFNTCYFVMVLLQNIGNNVEMDTSLCNFILETILDLLYDQKANVRVQALKALVRLQEPGNADCVVLKSFLVLFTDTNSEVRKTVVSLIALHPQSFTKIKERLTDVDIGVRLAAYTKLAETNPRLYLKIVDRNHILTCAFSEQNKKIKQILTEKLLPKWLNAFGGNYLHLLKALKLDADENDIKNFEDLCVKVMGIYLSHSPLSDIIEHLPLNKEEKLIPTEELHLESVLYWCILINHLRKEDESERYLEGLLPELTPFSNYIERVIKEKTASSMDEWENITYQNIIYQLFNIAAGFDMAEEVGRKTFYALIIKILASNKFQPKVICKIISVGYQLNPNIETFTSDMCHIISEIREPLEDELPSEEKVRAKDFQISMIKGKIHDLEITEEKALKVKDFQHANIVHNELIECQRQLEDLKNMYSDKVRKSKDDPETLCRCLDILIGLLKLPHINKMSSALLSCKEEFLMPLFNNLISDVHWRFILCLTLYSIIDKDTAFEHANFICLPIATYRAVPNYDKAALKISVLSVTDLIRIYGVKVIGIEEDKESVTSQEQNQTTNRRKLYTEDMDDLQVANKDHISVEFIIDIILDMLDDEDEDVRNTAASSISKLIVHEFPVSPELISRLILKWYNPMTERKDIKLQQKIGLIIRCFTDKVKGARKLVESAVLPIISSLANAPITSPLLEVDVDNVLRFLSALTNISGTDETENIHDRLALKIIEKISNKPNDICTPHLAKMLTYLEVEFEDQTVKKNLLSSAESILDDVDKGPNKHIMKFISKLKENLTMIQEEKDGETMGDEDISTETKDTTNVAKSDKQEDSIPNASSTSKDHSEVTKEATVESFNNSKTETQRRILYQHTTEDRSADNEDGNQSGNSSDSSDESEVDKSKEKQGRIVENNSRGSENAHNEFKKPNGRVLRTKRSKIHSTDSEKEDIDKVEDSNESVFIKCDYSPSRILAEKTKKEKKNGLLEKKSTSNSSEDEERVKVKQNKNRNNLSPKVNIISQHVLNNRQSSVAVESLKSLNEKKKRHVTAESQKSSSEDAGNFQTPTKNSTSVDVVRSSPRVVVLPSKLKDFETPLSTGKAKGSPGRTPFRKRPARTPLSAIGTRLSKRISVSSRSCRKRTANTPASKKKPNKMPKTSTNKQEATSTRRGGASSKEGGVSNEEGGVSEGSSSKKKSNENDSINETNSTKRRTRSSAPSFSSNRKNRMLRREQLKRTLRKETEKNNVRYSDSNAHAKISKKEKSNDAKRKKEDSDENDKKSSHSINNNNSESTKRKSSRLEIKTEKTVQRPIINEKQDKIRKEKVKNAEVDERAKKDLNIVEKTKDSDENSRLKQDDVEEKRRSHRINKPLSMVEPNRNKKTNSRTKEKKKNNDIVHCKDRKDKHFSNNVKELSMRELRGEKISKNEGVLKNLNSAMNELQATNAVKCLRSEKNKNKDEESVEKSKNDEVEKSNRRISSRGNDQIVPFVSSTVTRSQRLTDKANHTMNKSRKHLDFSSSSEETILKTFLQGDEEFQLLEELSIDESTTRSNSSGDSKKENLSIDDSSTGSSRQTRSMRRPRCENYRNSDSESPKRKILRSKGSMLSVVH